ncbi:MAG: DNA polymerase III subunit gamma/tau, partial [Clostridia bacterium]|nr:DNA polymerase III subunit gamma/tau [Clostridia bacterium]
MAYLALYRRFRPQGFEGLIGQEHIVKILRNQINSGKIGHAYLFCGARGTGKTTVAKIFARAINCLHPENG